jgi:hypothetical protein
MVMTRMPRRFGLLIGTLVALAPLAMQPLPAAASTTGTLFGITGTSQNILARIDPATGAATQLTDLSVSGADAQSAGLVSDPSTHRLFLVRTSISPTSGSVQLLTINSQTGAILSRPTLPTVVQSLAFDTDTGTLFGITQTSVVRVNPTTGSLTQVAPISNPTSAVVSMAIAPTLHSIYLSLDAEDPNGTGTFSTQILTVDTQTGGVTTSPILSRSARSIAFDTSLGTMFGVSDCCPNDVLQIDQASGVVSFIANAGGNTQGYWTAIDPASHTLFEDVGTVDMNTGIETDQLASVDEVSGNVVLSPLAQTVGSLAFEPIVAITITPASLRADVQQAAASGAIKGHGLVKSLLATLDDAAKARARGDCKAAGRIYNSFIKQVNKESPKHIAPSTATKLVSEAQFLIANCP